MSSVELNSREREFSKFLNDGKTVQDIVKETGLKISSVRTYLYSLRKKIAAGATVTTPKKCMVVKKEEAQGQKNAQQLLKLRRCTSVPDLRSILDDLEKPLGSLADRALLFKKATCMVCPHPSSCTRCSAKLLMDKFLYEK